MENWIRVVVAAAMVGSAAPGASALSAQASETLVITAETVTPGERERAGDAVFPGDVVLYRLTFTNRETTPVRNVVLANPVPAGLEYVGGSASASVPGVVIEYSIDAGGTYSEEPMVERVVDGRREWVPAPVESYTNVRWTVSEWVAPGDRIEAAYRVRLTEVQRER